MARIDPSVAGSVVDLMAVPASATVIVFPFAGSIGLTM